MRVFVVVVLALTLVGTASAEPSHPIRFPALTELASKIAGHPVDALCESPQDWQADPVVNRLPNGLVAYSFWNPDGRSGLAMRWDACAGAVLMISDPNERKIRGGYLATKKYRDLRALGLLFLLHESNHLIGAGDHDEAAVECRAISSFLGVALSLGADQKHADALYGIALEYHRHTPPSYQTVC